MIDLWGNEIPDCDPPKREDGAHPATPGTGPEGETCKTCANLSGWEGARNYYKCLLLKDNWTHGAGTDIKLKHAACSFWTKADSHEKKMG